ncbi:hypothetical protein BDV23DRAFT_149813 [Aspergillus alliaceus]|uniref:Uncharacterized protein n=1 Tax=Petromyces alliaceus TaxID=209559 RepID=A0A5N7CH98_PETAA|nr:hypothetical protein BDV23DRAFT_149813 [Aspergillus alliaceus]
MSRLQWLVRIFRLRAESTNWFYEVPYWTVTSYVEQATALSLILFASLSAVLSSMQVLVSIPVADYVFVSQNASHVTAVAWVFAVAVLVTALAIWIFIVLMPLIV